MLDLFFFLNSFAPRSLSLTGSDAAQAGGVEIGRASSDWQAVTALPPCLDDFHHWVEVHVCNTQRYPAIWFRGSWKLLFFGAGNGENGRFYFICHKTEKYLILYTLLSAWLEILTAEYCVCFGPCQNLRKLQLIQGKTFCPQVSGNSDCSKLPFWSKVNSNRNVVTVYRWVWWIMHRSWQAHLCEER